MSAKNDQGKLRLSLVPRQIIREIAAVRMFGTKKYKDPDNWKTVEPERYRDAAYRHFLAYLDDPQSVDPESGLKHLSHLACNIAFLCELENQSDQVSWQYKEIDPGVFCKVATTWAGKKECANCMSFPLYPSGPYKNCDNQCNWTPADKERYYAR